MLPGFIFLLAWYDVILDIVTGRALAWLLNRLFTEWIPYIVSLVAENVLVPVAELILDKLRPIIEFLLSSIFELVIKGFLIDIVFNYILFPFFKFLWRILIEVLSKLLYFILEILLILIDVFQNIIDTFAGIRPVYLKTGNTEQKTSLINILFLDPTFKRFFLGIMLIGVALAFLFAIYAIITSIFDLGNGQDNNKRTIGVILGDFAKSILLFILMPFIALSLINLSAEVLKQIKESIYINSEEMKLDRTLFCIFTQKAYRGPVTFDSNYVNYSTDEPYVSYLTGRKSYRGGWHGDSSVASDFDIQKIDYIVGIFVSLFMLLFLISCGLIFILKIFDIFLLYLASPIFVASIQLDGGQKFGDWRTMFMAKLMSGYGSIISMGIFLNICPLITSGRIRFTTNDDLGAIFDYALKVLFLLGGMYAVYSSQNTLTQIINYQAGNRESMATSTAFDVGARRIGGAVGGLITSGAKAGYGAVKDKLFPKSKDPGGGKPQMPKFTNPLTRHESPDGGNAYQGNSPNPIVSNLGRPNSVKTGGQGLSSKSIAGEQSSASPKGMFSQKSPQQLPIGQPPIPPTPPGSSQSGVSSFKQASSPSSGQSGSSSVAGANTPSHGGQSSQKSGNSGTNNPPKIDIPSINPDEDK